MVFGGAGSIEISVAHIEVPGTWLAFKGNHLHGGRGDDGAVALQCHVGGGAVVVGLLAHRLVVGFVHDDDLVTVGQVVGAGHELEHVGAGLALYLDHQVVGSASLFELVVALEGGLDGGVAFAHHGHVAVGVNGSGSLVVRGVGHRQVVGVVECGQLIGLLTEIHHNLRLAVFQSGGLFHHSLFGGYGEALHLVGTGGSGFADVVETDLHFLACIGRKVHHLVFPSTPGRGGFLVGHVQVGPSVGTGLTHIHGNLFLDVAEELVHLIGESQ